MVNLPAFFLAFLICLMLIIPFNSIASKINGFSLKLIPRNSPESPFYNKNLNETEMIQELIELSDERVRILESSNLDGYASMSLENIRFPVNLQGYMYAVSIQLGNPKRTFMLLFDTGGDLTWIQCLPCLNCFEQSEPIYDPKASSSYKMVSCNHPACHPYFKCIDGVCKYDIAYGQEVSGAPQTKGVLSFEQLWFSHDRRTLLAKDDFVFGCSHDNSRFQFDPSHNIGGILGMSKGINSLSTQFLDQSNGRFSYCLIGDKTVAQAATSILRFGNDVIVPEGDPLRTPFVRHKVKNYYYLSLLDISVVGRRINLPHNTFAIKEDGNGGCVIDSGSFLSSMVMDAYVRVREVFVEYYARLNRVRVRDRGGLELCFMYDSTFHEYASMTYHFEGADFFVHPKYVHFFNGKGRYFCVGLKPANYVTMVGSLHQQNTRFIYDRRKGELQFISANCAQDQE